MTIKVVLLDCDGVLQLNPDFQRLMRPHLGADDAFADLWEVEHPYLTRTEGFRAVLEAWLTAREASVSVDEFIAAWNDTSVVPGMLDVVDRVRAAGVPVYLATNQQPIRAQHMQTFLPYSDHTDGAFYSCDVGHCKPSPGYFRYILDALPVEPQEMLFVDDLLENVEGARSVGLDAEQLTTRGSVEELEAILSRHGVGDLTQS